MRVRHAAASSASEADARHKRPNHSDNVTSLAFQGPPQYDHALIRLETLAVNFGFLIECAWTIPVQQRPGRVKDVVTQQITILSTRKSMSFTLHFPAVIGEQNR